MDDSELDEIERQIDATVPYYVKRLIYEIRAQRRRAESAEAALDAATAQLEAASNAH